MNKLDLENINYLQVACTRYLCLAVRSIDRDSSVYLPIGIFTYCRLYIGVRVSQHRVSRKVLQNTTITISYALIVVVFCTIIGLEDLSLVLPNVTTVIKVMERDSYYQSY